MIGRICEKHEGFKLGVKSEEITDDESSESTKENDAIGTGRGESETERLG